MVTPEHIRMRSVALLGGCLVAVCLLQPEIQAGETALKVIKERMLQALIEDLNPRTGEKSDPAATLARAREIAAELQDDGTWAVVNYTDRSRSEWKPIAHLTRLRPLALACRQAPQEEIFQTKARLALRTWVARDLASDNWWWNDIGSPQALGDILILLEPYLPADEFAAAVKMVGRAPIDRTGQNRVWLSGVALTRAALLNDRDLARRAVDSIVSTITIDQPEGIQPDFSFFQHGTVLYSGGYGLAFSADCARYMAWTSGTDLAFPEATQKLLSSYILDGQCWMVRGDCFDFSATGRELTRPKAERKGRAVAVACERLAVCEGPRQAEFAGAAKRLRQAAVGVAGEPDGARYFWRAGLLVHRRPGYYFSIRMARADLLSGDGIINGENLRSQFLADGLTYLIKSGEEYRGVFGVWDWRRPPGVTNRADAPCVGNPNEFGRRRFAGAATDGRYSVAAMDWSNPARGPEFPADQLTARKAWFCFDREIVCLGAGIQCAADHPILTSINQCRLSGPVTLAEGVVEPGTRELQGPAWVHHAGVGYVFPKGNSACLVTGNQAGSWHDCNSNLPADRLELPMFNLWIDHGRTPQDAAYAYTLLPDATVADLTAYAAKNDIEILTNTAALQAVRHLGLHTVGAAFYGAGKLSLAAGGVLEVDQGCIVLVSPGADGSVQISIAKPDCDPQEATVVTVRYVGVEQRVTLPVGAESGRSVTVAWPVR